MLNLKIRYSAYLYICIFAFGLLLSGCQSSSVVHSSTPQPSILKQSELTSTAEQLSKSSLNQTPVQPTQAEDAKKYLAHDNTSNSQESDIHSNDNSNDTIFLNINRFKMNSLKSNKHPTIALVLGSGGARGYAHIGVIEVLEAYGIRPDFIVGTSAGSIVGAIYASGKSPQQLRQIALDMKVADVREITFDRKGFFDGKKVEDFVNQQVNYTPLDKLNIPMYVVATELKEGKKTVFNAGNTGQAVRASISIPSMFVPIKINHKEYVDGGLVSPVPVDVARQLGADIIIAVDILAQPEDTETTNMWGLFNQNINIMQNRLAKIELNHADIVIQPKLHEKAHIFDVKAREATIDAGEQATLEKIKQIEILYKQQQNTLEANQKNNIEPVS